MKENPNQEALDDVNRLIAGHRQVCAAWVSHCEVALTNIIAKAGWNGYTDLRASDMRDLRRGLIILFHLAAEHCITELMDARNGYTNQVN